MEIRPINWIIGYSNKTQEKKQKNIYSNEDVYNLDIEINSQEKNNTAFKTGDTASAQCQTYGCGQSADCTQPNSACICSGINCGGTVCSNC